MFKILKEVITGNVLILLFQQYTSTNQDSYNPSSDVSQLLAIDNTDNYFIPLINYIPVNYILFKLNATKLLKYEHTPYNRVLGILS